MKRILIASAAVFALTAAAVPAFAGLADNPSFSHKLPVHAPPQAQLVTFDDHGHSVSATTASSSSSAHPTASPTATVGGSTEPGDDNGGQRSSATAEPGDDNGGQSSTAETEPGDDNGGQSSTAETEPGDDNGATSSSTPTAGDDNGGTPTAAPTAADDKGGHGADNGGSASNSGH
jgi:hypothetical protein